MDKRKDEEPHTAEATDGITPLEPGLRLALTALRPYLHQLVLIGGWVPQIHRRYGAFSGWVGHLSLTSEADILIPRTLPADSRPRIVEALQAVGMRPQGSTAVWVGELIRGEHVEFLVAHVGTARDLGRPTTIGDQAPLAAVALARLAILERHTTTIAIPAGASDASEPILVRVPLLGAYVIQKAATFMDRSSKEKKAKDLLYIRDVLAAGPTAMARLRGEMAALAEADPADIAPMARTAFQNLEGVVQRPPRPVLRDAARMRHEREPGASFESVLVELEGRLHDAAALLNNLTSRKVRGRARKADGNTV